MNKVETQGDKMTKADQTIALMDEALGTPVKSAADLKAGKTVIFKPGHALAGLIGRVIQAKDKTADVMVGSSPRLGIPFGDLLLAPEVDLGKPGPG